MTQLDRPTAPATPPTEPDQAAGRTSTFAALRVVPYRRLFFAGMIVFLAVQVQVIARGWLAFELTGSNSGLGGVFMGFGIPMLLATPLGGVLTDRVPKRRMLMLSQSLLVVSASWIGLAVIFDVVQYWMLIGAAAMQAVGFAFFGPARMAFTGELVGRHTLANAVVLGQMSMNSTRIFGPALAGVLIGVAWVGVGGVYLISSALIVLSTAFIAGLPPGDPAPDRPVRSPLADFTDGLRHVRDRPQLTVLLLTSFVVVMVAFPYVAFLPTVAERIFEVGASGYGAMSAATAVGALAVSFAIAGRAGGTGAWRIQALAGLGFGVGLVVLSGVPTYQLALVAVLITGASASGFQSMNNSLALALADLEYHGRVQSLMMLSFSGFGMAALPLGVIADQVGLRTTLLGMGLVTILAVTIASLVRRRVGSAPVEAVVPA